MRPRVICCLWVLCMMVTLVHAAAPASVIADARITGGLIVQVSAGDLGLQALGERFHVRILLAEAAAVEQAQAAIDQAGLQGRFTVSRYDGTTLPFADRVVNALVLGHEGLVGAAEARVGPARGAHHPQWRDSDADAGDAR